MSAVPPIALHDSDGVLREPGDEPEAVRPEYLINRLGYVDALLLDDSEERSPFGYLRSSMTAPTTSRES